MNKDEKLSAVNTVIDTYIKFYKPKAIPEYEIYVSKSLFTDRLSLCNSLKEYADVMAQKGQIEQLHGTVVFPDEQSNIFYLLVREDRFDSINSFIGTSAHEFTHIIDFFDFFLKAEIVNGRYISHPDWPVIHFYSEVRARYRGATIMWIAQEAAITKDAIYDLISAYEPQLNYQLDLYYTAQLYGQLLAVKKLFPNLQFDCPYFFQGSISLLLDAVGKHIDDNSIIDGYDEVKSAYKKYMEDTQ